MFVVRHYFVYTWTRSFWIASGGQRLLTVYANNEWRPGSLSHTIALTNDQPTGITARGDATRPLWEAAVALKTGDPAEPFLNLLLAHAGERGAGLRLLLEGLE